VEEPPEQAKFDFDGAAFAHPFALSKDIKTCPSPFLCGKQHTAGGWRISLQPESRIETFIDT
jgi:hypothetical protein